MILVKTEKGQQAFYTRSHHLSPCQRTAFALADGKRSVKDILANAAHLGLQQEHLDAMLELGFVQVDNAPVHPEPSVEAKAQPPLTEQQRYLRAKPIATQLTAAMGIRGFRLNLAVEAASGTADLRVLLPRIQSAVGAEKCLTLARALHD